MIRQKIILTIVILLLIASNVYFGFKYLIIQKEFQQTQAILATQKTNEKILDFTKFFIDQDLRAEQEVVF